MNSDFTSQNTLQIGSRDVESTIENNCILIPENNFLPETYFLYNKNSEIEEFMNNILKEAFKEEKINGIVINARYFAKEGNYRKIIHNFIDAQFSTARSISTSNKEYIIIMRKNEFSEYMSSAKKEEIQQAVDYLYLKNHTFGVEKRENESKDDDTPRNKSETDLELDEQKEEKEELFLPVIQKIEILNITHSTLTIKLPIFDVEKIVNRNRPNVRLCYKRFSELPITYVILFLNPSVNQFYEHSTHKENVIQIEDLKPATCYIFKVLLKLGEYYSTASKCEMFYTHSDPNLKHTYYALGNNHYNNLVINSENMDKQEFMRRHNIQSDELDLKTIFTEKGHILSPIALRNCQVTSFSNFNDFGVLVFAKESPVSSGKCYTLKDGDVLDFQESTVDKVEIRVSEPYLLQFPWGAYVRQVACGFDFCLVLTNLGECFSWGTNDFGQLGLNMPKDVVVNEPRRVKIQYENQENVFVTTIAAGCKHALVSVFVNDKTKLFSWGYGQGFEPIISPDEQVPNERLRKVTNSFSPILLPFEETDRVVKVVAKYNQSALICQIGNKKKLYTFGSISNMQLGFVVDFFKHVFYWGFPTTIDLFNQAHLEIVDISFGEEHTLFLVHNSATEANELYACGLNKSHQCGFTLEDVVTPELVADIKDPTRVSAGTKHSLVYTKDRKAWLLGKTDLLNNAKPIISELEDLYPILENAEIVKMECNKENISLLIK